MAARTAAEYIDKYISGNVDEFRDRIKTTCDEEVFVSCGERVLKKVVRAQFLDVLVSFYGNKGKRKLLRAVLKKFPLEKALKLEGDDAKFNEIVEIRQRIKDLQVTRQRQITIFGANKRAILKNLEQQIAGAQKELEKAIN